jgi:hypothetical protein
MSPLMKTLLRLARPRQGRKLANQARAYAQSPQGRKQIEQARARLAKRRRPR